MNLPLLMCVWIDGESYMFVCGSRAADFSVIVFVLHAGTLTAALKITQRP